jgi:hypothetical protein
MFGGIVADKVPAGIMLCVRSRNGDLILRPVHLLDRPELADPATGALGLGFVSEPFPVEMLLGGAYNVELILLKNDCVETLPLPMLIIKKASAYIVRGSASHVIKIPSVGAARASFGDRRNNGDMWYLDDRVIVNWPSELPGFGSALRLVGWMICEQETTESLPVSLHLFGLDHFEVPLEKCVRADVAQAKNKPALTMSGFSNLIWLSDLPPGLYDVELGKKLPTEWRMRPIGKIRVQADGSARYMRSVIAGVEIQTDGSAHYVRSVISDVLKRPIVKRGGGAPREAK